MSENKRNIKPPAEDLDAFLNRMISLEQSHVAALGTLVATTDNELITSLADIILSDSRKHASLYTALTHLRRRETAEILDYEAEENLVEALKTHIETEAGMIKELEEKRRGDLSRIEVGFLEAILDDEHRHHRVLTALTKLITATNDKMEKYYALSDVLSNPAGRGSPTGKW